MTPNLTTIIDTLYAPDGSLVDGVIYITNTSTMISSDGDEVPDGMTKAVRIIRGALCVSLVPNLGATPSGTSYRVKYQITSQYFTETWIVPETPNPCTLADVRSLTPPISDVMIPVAQVLPPSDMEPGNVLEWNGTQWVPGEESAPPYQISIYIEGVTANTETLLYLPFASAVTFPASATLSQATAKTAATASTTYTLSCNGTQFASFTFAASGTTATWSQASDQAFAAGDVLEIDGPATADATLANIGVVFVGTYS